MKIEDLYVAYLTYKYHSNQYNDGTSIVIPNGDYYINLFPNPNPNHNNLKLEHCSNRYANYTAELKDKLINYIPDEFLNNKKYDNIDELREDVLNLIIRSKQVEHITILTKYCFSKEDEDKVKRYYKKSTK